MTEAPTEPVTEPEQQLLLIGNMYMSEIPEQKDLKRHLRNMAELPVKRLLSVKSVKDMTSLWLIWLISEVYVILQQFL